MPLLNMFFRHRQVTVDWFTSRDASQAETLVMLVHGLTGRRSLDGLVNLVQVEMPDADVGVLDYGVGLISNQDPREIANVLEDELHRRFLSRRYAQIILLGHSAGCAVLRKAFVWGLGQEEDRDPRKGPHAWTGAVRRIVMLAGINRGWSVEEKPAQMNTFSCWAYRAAVMFSRWLGFGGFVRGVMRGAPFIANTRIQWLRAARAHQLPQVIQLLGDRDDIVAREDSMDLLASPGTLFKTLLQTNHSDITAVLQDPRRPQNAARAQDLRLALLGRIDELDPDQPFAAQPWGDARVRRLTFVMHGIRDHGQWTVKLRAELERELAELEKQDGHMGEVENPRYGYFPMLGFLQLRDRQRNVRRFVDAYTEAMARYPQLQHIDFAGHSNGTYLLASALEQCAALRVRRVYFGGSVVPKHYRWQEKLNTGRVEQVINVVATGDWVVALFPKFFEQIADWIQQRPRTGLLDLGSAGFRGFEDEGICQGKLTNICFVRGAHSAAVATDQAPIRSAIARFLVHGDTTHLQQTLANARGQLGWLNVLSNVSWLVWTFLAGVAILLGCAASQLPWGLPVYVLFLLAVLASV